MSEDDQKPPLDAALRHLVEQKRRSLTSHPTPQELADYHAGELPPEAEARILDHLAICRECSDLLLDLSGFADLKPPAGVPELTDEQVDEDWQALRSRIGKDQPERKPAEVVPIRPVVPAPKPGYWLPIAASLLAVIGFSFGLYQSTRVSSLSRSKVVPMVSYSDVERGEAGGNPRISSSRGGVILLMPDLDKDYPEYEAEVVFNDKVLERIPIGEIEGDSVPLVIPGPLAPGTYHVRLYGLDQGSRELSSELQFDANDP